MSTGRQPRKKKRKVAASSDGGNNFVKFLAEASDDAALGLLETQLVPWLGINETTHVGSTCRSMKQRILKGSYRIALEERQSTKMRYGAWGCDFGTSVYQVQPFRFIVTGTDVGKLQVNVKLVNWVYDERHNERECNMCEPLENFPKQTQVECKIYRDNSELFFRTGGGHEHVICGCGNCFYCRGGYEVQGIVDSFDDGSTDQDAVHTNLEIAVRAFFLCAQRVSEMTNLPQKTRSCLPVGYMIRKLPSDLHGHVPKGFDWKAPHKDRKTRLEWMWRPANTVEEWWEQGLYGHNDEPGEYELDELPWYRDDYEHEDFY